MDGELDPGRGRQVRGSLGSAGPAAAERSWSLWCRPRAPVPENRAGPLAARRLVRFFEGLAAG